MKFVLNTNPIIRENSFGIVFRKTSTILSRDDGVAMHEKYMYRIGSRPWTYNRSPPDNFPRQRGSRLLMHGYHVTLVTKSQTSFGQQWTYQPQVKPRHVAISSVARLKLNTYKRPQGTFTCIIYGDINNFVHRFLFNAITNPYSNFNCVLTKVPLKLWWVNASKDFTRV